MIDRDKLAGFLRMNNISRIDLCAIINKSIWTADRKRNGTLKLDEVEIIAICKACNCKFEDLI